MTRFTLKARVESDKFQMGIRNTMDRRRHHKMNHDEANEQITMIENFLHGFTSKLAYHINTAVHDNTSEVGLMYSCNGYDYALTMHGDMNKIEICVDAAMHRPILKLVFMARPSNMPNPHPFRIPLLHDFTVMKAVYRWLTVPPSIMSSSIPCVQRIYLEDIKHRPNMYIQYRAMRATKEGSTTWCIEAMMPQEICKQGISHGNDH